MGLESDVVPLSRFVAAAVQVGEPLVEPIAVVAFILLLAASAVVSGSEVALFSLSSTVKENLAATSDRASNRVLALLAKPQRLLITILLLNTCVNVAAAVLAAFITEDVASALGFGRSVVSVLEVVALTFVLLVVSEITPKLIASRYAVTYSRLVSAPLRAVYWIVSPVVTILAAWMHRTQRWMPTVLPEVLSSEDLKVMAEIGAEHGSLGTDEREWIHSIVDFGATPVRAIMINRLDITALPITATLPEALDLIRRSGHSRLPLYADHLDNIRGVIYAKDLLPFLHADGKKQQVDWMSLKRPPMFVPQGKKLDDLLSDFQRKKTHLAIVVDEYGGTAGIVTLEDVLEEVVGDIRDEHDEEEETWWEQLDNGDWRFDARIDLDDLSDLLELNLNTEEFDFETLGGLVFHLTGDIPSVGDTLDHQRLHMKVEAVENNRIRFVRVHLKENPSE